MRRDMDFGKRAEAYDEARQGRISQRFYDFVMREAALRPGARVLDVGCGTGTLLRALADRKGIVGTGIDISANMLSVARRKCPEMAFYESRCEAMPFEGGSFDALTVCMAYHHFADQAAFRMEAARVLAPGGLLIIADGKLPAPIRATANFLGRVFRVAANIESRAGIERAFSEVGFAPEGYASEGIAQIVTLRLNHPDGA